MTTIPPSPAGAFCCVCRCACGHDNAIMLEGQWVCGACKPKYLDMLKNGTQPTDLLLARDGNRLVMGRQAQLPHRCIKCNEPAEGAKLKRQLSWHNPWWFLLLPCGLLICVIVIMCVQKKATVEVGLCEAHRRRRNKGRALGWGAFAMFVLGIAVSVVSGNGLFVAAGILLLLAGLVCAVVMTGTVSAAKIDDRVVWLKGVSPVFLDGLPVYQGK